MICAIAGSVGCVSRTGLESRDVPGDQRSGEMEKEFQVFSNGTMEKQLFGSGVDSRAKDIEKRLGFKER